jgi:hypothetical protein
VFLHADKYAAVGHEVMVACGDLDQLEVSTSFACPRLSCYWFSLKKKKPTDTPVIVPWTAEPFLSSSVTVLLFNYEKADELHGCWREEIEAKQHQTPRTALTLGCKVSSSGWRTASRTFGKGVYAVVVSAVHVATQRCITVRLGASLAHVPRVQWTSTPVVDAGRGAGGVREVG